MSEYGPPERVYVENDWYDGPQAGVADIHGVPHRFKSIFDEAKDDYSGVYLVWPIGNHMLALEVEQWGIFVAWNELFESGQVQTDSHPSHGGLNKRWDELETLLKQNRTEVPIGSRRAVFQFVRMSRKERFAPSGPDYMLIWNIL